MRYIYKNGFNFGHWFFDVIGNFVTLFAIILKILSLNLVYFNFEMAWFIYSMEKSDKLTKWFNNLFKLKC
jgi:hypothetical protein